MLITDAVVQAQANANYLIVTNPEKLYAHDASSADVDWLLNTLAELAVVKQGMLGYMEGYGNVGVEDDLIESWGASMQGSDGTPGGYLTDGYLLLVGENEIVPAGRMTLSHWYFDSRTIEFTDVYYADTASNIIDPELRVGRIIGNTARELILPIHTIINVYSHTPGFSFNRSNALVVSGFSETRGGGADNIDFRGERWDVVDHLSSQGIPSTQMHTPDYSTVEQSVLEFLAHTPGMDFIHLAGHGSSSTLDDYSIYDLDRVADPFGDANPIVYGSSCNTGRYMDGISFAEKFLQKGAGIFLGSTADSSGMANRAAANAIYHRLDPGRSFGSVLNEVKTGIGGDYYYGFKADVWTVEYHLFGDPEYGADLSSSAGEAQTPGTSVYFSNGRGSVQQTVPAYQVTLQADGTHWVEIPGGGWVMAPFMPVVPDYALFTDISAQYIVQDVRLVQRGGLTTASGLNLPLYTDAQASDSSSMTEASQAASEWFPELDFTWSVSQNPDSSSRMRIQLYPFVYNSLTQQARFYQDFIFEITTIPASPRLVDLTLDQCVYEPGQNARIDLQLNNPGQALDAFLEVKIMQPGSDRPVAGLPLYTLNGLAGNALVSLDWNSGNLPPGDYFILAEVRDLVGHLYDTRQESFKIGQRSGDIEAYSVSPLVFKPGQPVQIAYNFRNTGTQALDGRAMIEVQDLTSGTELRYEQEFTSLPANQSLPVQWT